MRALFCHAWGSVEDLVVAALPSPAPAAEQVPIKAAAPAGNLADSIMVRRT